MDKKKLAVVGLVLSIVSAVSLLFLPETVAVAQVIAGIAILLGIVGTVLGFLGKDASKGLGLSAIIIGIISSLLLALTLIGLMVIGAATDCVDNGNGTYTCDYLGTETEVPSGMLREDQIKK